MPDLNKRQFEQQRMFDPGPKREPLADPAVARAESSPGADYDRAALPGQQVMNFDVPDMPLEYATPTRYDSPSAVYVTPQSDPDFSNKVWEVGGARRAQNDGRFYTSADKTVTESWEGAPLQRIGPEAELRTSQLSVYDDKVQELRDVPPSGYDEHPWVARVAGKQYLLEGHHRASAARRSRTGEFNAHVIEADSVDDLVTQVKYPKPPMYSAPESRPGEPLEFRL